MREGDLIAESFLLEQRTANGGMGTVFRGRDTRSGAHVAVKTWLPPPHGSPNEASASQREQRKLARFEREARVLAAIDDPAIVPYVAHGTTPGGEPFLVMRWIEGPDLSATLRARGLGLLQTLQLAARLVPALSVLHGNGIVHRDLKPANIVLEHADVRRAVIVDFGVARRSQLGLVTHSGARVGTPSYMAPEQIRDPRQVDGRADVFALGCVLFECLAGARPFDSEDALGAIAQILLDDAPDLRSLRAELPAGVSELVARMLRRDRSERPLADAVLQGEIERLLQNAERADVAPPHSIRARAASATSDSEVQPEALVARGSEPAPVTRAAARVETPVSGLTERLNAARLRPRSPLVGRRDELSHLLGLHASGAKLIVLWGPAGIGKTRLALELAATERPDTSGVEAWFIDLTSARSIEDALRILALCTQARVSGSELASSAIGRVFSQRQKLLVVLDAVDGFMRELGPLLLEWQGQAAGVCFVVTTRERGRWPAAINVAIGPLPASAGSHPCSGPNAALSPAAEFLLHCVREQQPEFVADQRTLPRVEQLAAALEGIPLAIELAAARVCMLGLEAVLCRPLHLLSLPSGDGASAMHDAIFASYELLNGDERAVLECCALFPSAFSVAAAEAVAAERSAAPLMDVLHSLREKSLLCSTLAEGSGETRLYLFRVIREYALSELRQNGGEAEAQARHLRYTAKRVAALRQLRRSRPSLEVLRAVESEAEDLLAAIEYALSSAIPNLTLALESWLALEPVVVARGPLPAFLTELERTIARVEVERASSDPRLLAQVYQLRARLLATSGHFQQAESDLEWSRALGEQLADRRLEGSAWLELGVTRHLQRRLVEARACYERALELIRNQGELRSEGRCFGNLGAVLHDEARLTEAAAYYWKAIQLLEDAGEPRELANFLSNLAVLEQELGNLDSARRRYDRAVALLGEASDARLCAIALGNLGGLEAESGNWPRARACHARALELLLPLADGYSEGLCRARLGAALACLGLLAAAETELGQAQRLLTQADPARVEAVRLQRAFLDLALAKSALAEYARAEVEARLERAEARVSAVEHEGTSSPPLSALSDDIRLTLRVLKPLLSEFRACLAQSPDVRSGTVVLSAER